MTGVPENAVAKPLVELGTACVHHQDENLRNVAARNVQCEEIWSFVGIKEMDIPKDKQGYFGYGDV